MSDGIKRYIFHDYRYGSADMEEDDCGDYVKFDDYSLLQAKNAQLKEEISDLSLVIELSSDGAEKIQAENARLKEDLQKIYGVLFSNGFTMGEKIVHCKNIVADQPQKE